jgi:enoyl-CoA hydratase/carnithine racemase
VETMRLESGGAVARLTLDRPRVLNAGNRQWVADPNETMAIERMDQFARWRRPEPWERESDGRS